VLWWRTGRARPPFDDKALSAEVLVDRLRELQVLLLGRIVGARSADGGRIDQDRVLPAREQDVAVVAVALDR
jgi:hypothetical protein